MAGFAIFSVLGFMSYEQGLPISEVAASGKNTTRLVLQYIHSVITFKYTSVYVKSIKLCIAFNDRNKVTLID